MPRGIQTMSENTTTEPTMLSAKNFPDVKKKMAQTDNTKSMSTDSG